MRAPRPCAARGCPALVQTPERFCAQHKRDNNARVDAARGSSQQRGYGATWRRLRDMVLARQPLCADPFGKHQHLGETVLATDVDHIKPRREGGEDTVANLQPLCHVCHSRKTASVDGGFGKRGNE